MGNTVLVVEHDEDAIRTADHVIDMGRAPASMAATSSPKARRPRSFANKKSLTGKYLRAAAVIADPAARRKAAPNRWLEGCWARAATISRMSPPRFRWAPLTCITGVSGGGKSTLTIETLYKAGAPGSWARRANIPPPMTASRAWNSSTR